MNLVENSTPPHFLNLGNEVVTPPPPTPPSPPELFTEDYLEQIKIKIESMSKLQHIEVLKIIKKYKTIKINENKNGVYINISYLPKKTVQELELYIKYIDDQSTILNQTI
jgi:ribosome maturation protein Sdo1